MTRSRIITTSALAVFAVLVTSTAAFAAPNAVANDDLVVRKNPNKGSQKINFVEEGDLLALTKCQSGYCFAKGIPGPDGWVPQNGVSPIDDEGEVDTGVPFSFGITIGPGGPSITIGGGSSSGSSGPTSGPRACFFQHSGYAGASFCVALNKTVNSLASTGFNDQISSIRLYGGAEVQVCEHAGFGGDCTTFSSNKSSLPAGWNDIISSVEVY